MFDGLFPPDAAGMPWLALGLGAVLLALGRRLYLLAVGSAGFVFGAWVTLQLGFGGVAWLVAAVIAGLLCALLALFLQRVAVGVAGFLVGLLALLSAFDAYRVALEGWAWLIPVLGALVIAALFSALFDVALVVLSSLVGAGIVVAAIGLGGGAGLVLFVVLLSIGVALQSRALYRQEPTPSS